MPPRQGSRHTFTQQITDTDDGSLYLTERVPLERDKGFSDDEEYTVKQGDTWFSIAARRYPSLVRGCGFWWVIADYVGVIDPTVPPTPGTEIWLPSAATVRERVFNERRRRDH